MLHQLEFKLQVEMQYKNGIDKMAKLYQADLDKRSRQDVETKKMESKRVESDTKIQLLQTALKQYKNLHILDDDEEEEGKPSDSCLHLKWINKLPFIDVPEGGERKDNLRKPLSGKLQVTIKGARELDHAPFLKFGRSYKPINETTVVIKVEGTQRARSHPSRTDRWMEDFEMSVDKANEVEIAVYDKQVGTEVPVPIGLLWVNISDIVEALRRAKVQEEGKGGGWVTAGAMRDGSYNGGPGYEPTFGQGGQGGQGGLGANAPMQFAVAPGDPAAPGMGMQQQPEGIEAWFAVEPAGALALRLNFGSSTMVFGISIFKMSVYFNSQRERPETASRRWWFRPSRRCSQAQGRGARDEWPQVHPKTVLPNHSLRVLQRISS
jgi:classical protein kinase C alpha type